VLIAAPSRALAEDIVPGSVAGPTPLGAILEDEAGDDMTRRIVTGLLMLGGGGAIIVPGVGLFDDGGLGAVAGIVFVGAGAGLAVSGIVTLAVTTDLEDLADEHTRVSRRSADRDVTPLYAERLEALANAAHGRRVFSGAMLSLAGASSLASAASEDEPPGIVVGGIGVALGLYMLLVQSNAEDALERYRALGVVVEASPGVQWLPSLTANADGISLGVGGQF
jgi:hypothetical protein